MDAGAAGKTISKKALSFWEEDLKKSFEFEEDVTGDKITRAKCLVCQKHCEKIKHKYKGKVVQDVYKYGVEGTTHVLKANLRRHILSDSHRRCLVLETGEPLCKKQKTITNAFGTAKQMARVSLKPLMTASLFLGRNEKPYSDYPKLLELCTDMGQHLTKAFSNDKAAKVFNHSIANQIVDDLRYNVVNKCHFMSFLVDGSTAAKRRLTYEAELLYIRTAHGMCPTTELCCLIPMGGYASVSSQNLFHAIVKELAALGNKEDSITNECFTKPVDEVSIDSLLELLRKNNFHMKIIGGGADGASVNFGCKKGLMQLYKATLGDWLVSIHCFSHRLELAAADALKPHFEDVNEFLKSLHLHFRNSPKEWCLVVKAGESIGIGVLVQPKAHGTRFIPHLLRALAVLRYNWGVYIMHFSDIKAQNKEKELVAKAVAWLKKLLSFKFLARCRLYEDIVEKLSITAKLFQAEDARSISDACRSFHTAQAEQELLVDEPGECEVDLWKRLAQGQPVEDDELPHLSVTTRAAAAVGGAPSVETSKHIILPCKKIRRDQQETDKQNKSRSKYIDRDHNEPFPFSNVVSKDEVYNLRKASIESLNKALNERFSEFDQQAHVLSKLTFLDTKMWPLDIKGLLSFCVEDVKWLLEHFRQPLQAADVANDVDVLREFRTMKMYYGPRLTEINLTPSNFWQMVYNQDKNKYRSILLVVELLLCLPFSTAAVERGFSSVRRILTDWRSQLGTSLVSDCMHFSTRKAQLAKQSYRNGLVDRACDSFLGAMEKESARDGQGMLTKRRINKILNGLEGRQTSLSESFVGVSTDEDLSNDLIELSNSSQSESELNTNASDLCESDDDLHTDTSDSD